MPPKKAQSRLHFSVFVRGVIYGMFVAGYTYREIAAEVEKTDGTNPCYQSVADCIDVAGKNGGMQWDGEAVARSLRGVGRPRETTSALDKKIIKLVFKNRGRALVTVNYIKKVIKAARKVSLRTLQRRLSEAGLAWLRRRRKTIVPEAHKQSRLDYAAWILTRTVVTLARWAYTDGTTFFLARCQTEKESTTRAALGPFVWRQANGSDGVYEECVGPSAYWKAQGTAIRVWGLLVAGILFIAVLPEGVCMNRWEYTKLIKNNFPKWLRAAFGHGVEAFLVQDHEKCLWTAEPRAAMRACGVHLLENFPKCSQDLNPIETAWRELRARLMTTEPVHIEHRQDFVVRLRNAVAWINLNRAAYLRKICSSQKPWARDVQAARGNRTKH